MSKASSVVVVGGGSIGCAVAYYAAKAGLSVTLVDNPKRGRATSASAGGTWPLGESLGLGCGIIYYKTLLKRGAMRADSIGPEQLPDCFLDFSLVSNAMFPNLASEVRERTGLDFEFEYTTLIFLMLDEADASFARMLLERFPRDKSLLQWMDREEVLKEEPALSPDNCGGLRFLCDHQVTPYRFADVLRAGARTYGAKIVPHTEVTGIRTAAGRVTGVETKDAFYPCEIVVNAAGSWAAEVGRMVDLKIPVYPVRGQIVCTETLPEILKSCVSTSDCYLAQKYHGEIIIGSTTEEEAGFDTRVTPQAIEELSKGAIRAVPFLERVHVKRVWAGLRPGSPDELPIIGPVDHLSGYLNACGHFRTGILNAPITGKLITEMIMEEQPSFDCRPFLLSRFTTDPALAPLLHAGERPPPKQTTSRVGSVGHSVRRYDGLVDFTQLMDDARRQPVTPGDVVIREGDVGDVFYVIVSGQLRVERGGRVLAHLGPGEFFGEMALLDDRRRSATVIAETGAELIAVDRDQFYRLLAEHPEMAATIMRVMALRLRAAPVATANVQQA